MIMHFHNDPKNKRSHTVEKERADFFKETNPPKTQVIHELTHTLCSMYSQWCTKADKYS